MMIGQRLVQRGKAAQDWLWMVVAFGVTVAATRIYLEATGYPQIGSGTLHFAHALWGGLLQFAALGVVLTFANRASFTWAAILGGVGAGLFVDEVGKFMTQQNDYFFPFAAPIIYTFFLLTMLLALAVRRRRAFSPREDLYFVLENMKDMADHDLDTNERAVIRAALERVIAQPQTSEQAAFAAGLLTLVDQAGIVPVPPPNVFQRLWAALIRFENAYVSHGLTKLTLIITFVINSMGGLLATVTLLGLFSSDAASQAIEAVFVSQALTITPTVAQWVVVNALFIMVIGVADAVVAVLLLLGRERTAIHLARISLVLQLSLGNLLGYYFNQFAMISATIFGLLIFWLVERYRARFVPAAALNPD